MSLDENDFSLIFEFQTILFFTTFVMIFLNISILSRFKNEIESVLLLQRLFEIEFSTSSSKFEFTSYNK